jgi:hypothetical protein
MANTAITTAIKAAIKSLGMNNNDVSVRSPRYYTVTLTIRSARAFAQMAAVKAIAAEYQSIDLCPSGDILSGSRFTQVKVDESVLMEVSEPHMVRAQELVDRVKASDLTHGQSYSMTVADIRTLEDVVVVHVGPSRWNDGNVEVNTPTDYTPRVAYSVREVAIVMATRYAELKQEGAI